MIYLIPIAYVNEVTTNSENIDEKKMKGNIEEAQSDLRELLGTEFYEQIETQYQSSFSTANNTLYEDYIKQFLAWQAFYYSLGFSQAESTPTGLRQFNDENSTILEDIKLHDFEKNVRRRALRYRYDLINYMRRKQEEDSTNFPLWDDHCKEEFSFAITSVSRETDAIISINRVVKDNE